MTRGDSAKSGAFCPTRLLMSMTTTHSLTSKDGKSRSNPTRNGLTPRYSFYARTRSARGGSLFAAVIAGAACLAMVNGWACTGNRKVNPVEKRVKVDANLQPLTLEQISHLEQKMFNHSLRQLRQAVEQPSHIAAADPETLTAKIFTQNPVQMQNVRFSKCAFEFPTNDTPSPYVRKLGQILLSSDLGSVFIPTL